ncbi:MAG: thiamine pyrophosphate-dependent enzyme [Candidatus Dormibacterales bacterium]
MNERSVVQGVLMSGNEAVARGAYEAGVRVVTGYPGTPSTEIVETLATFPAVNARWSPNEKVALDVALGASLGGTRALAVMKHVGLNVAADTFMTAAYVGVGGGLVIVSADDPGMHSSQNEQDNRFFARLAGVPLLEPADSEDARLLARAAFEISEEFDTPVLLRTTTRVAHGRSVVRPAERAEAPIRCFKKDREKYVMLPANARRRRLVLLERLERLRARAEKGDFTSEIEGDHAIGVVTSGIAYHYVREAVPNASVLKLALTNPLPIERIRTFALGVERLFVVEELEPFLEDALAAAGLRPEGKAYFPREGELSAELVRAGFTLAGVIAAKPALTSQLRGPGEDLPRPPVLCPGCPHSAPFLVLRRLGAVVAGDIGCYTLAALEPLAAMDTCVAMGSSIGMAVGLAASGGVAGPVVAAIGDSTFLHGGIQGLMEAVYSQANVTVLILDNGTTAMTGGQHHPGTGAALDGSSRPAVDLVELCRAIGVEQVDVVDPYDLGMLERGLRHAIAHRGPAVVITNRPCVEAPVKIRDQPFAVIDGRCIACQLCMNLDCPSLLWSPATWHEGRRRVEIDAASCTGCTVCAQLCPAGAIVPLVAAVQS